MAEKECIERDAALQFVFDACAECMDACEEFDGIYADCNQCMLEEVKLKLRDLPAADVRPVVHGEWIGYPECLKYPNAYADDHIVCSVCEECFSILDNCTEQFDFCPHCGADMRENGNETT